MKGRFNWPPTPRIWPKSSPVMQDLALSALTRTYSASQFTVSGRHSAATRSKKSFDENHGRTGRRRRRVLVQ